MSDEPKPIENSAEWAMPEPVFRTSDGHTPKGPPTDEVDTETPDAMNADDHLPVISDADAAATTEEMPAYKPAPVPKPKGGGCFKSFLFILGAIALFAAIIVAALIYFLFYYKPTDSLPF
jgi:hypothetical protein